jgi:hypothetical protein
MMHSSFVSALIANAPAEDRADKMSLWHAAALEVHRAHARLLPLARRTTGRAEYLVHRSRIFCRKKMKEGKMKGEMK